MASPLPWNTGSAVTRFWRTSRRQTWQHLQLVERSFSTSLNILGTLTLKEGGCHARSPPWDHRVRRRKKPGITLRKGWVRRGAWPAPRYVSHPSRSGKHGSPRPGGPWSSDHTSPAGPSNHTREPQGKDLLLSQSPQNQEDAELSKALGCGTTWQFTKHLHSFILSSCHRRVPAFGFQVSHKNRDRQAPCTRFTKRFLQRQNANIFH